MNRLFIEMILRNDTNKKFSIDENDILHRPCLLWGTIEQLKVKKTLIFHHF
jgi:hypothetical protein